MLMDATVPQEGGYRFVYVLPLGADELFVREPAGNLVGFAAFGGLED